MKTVFVWQKVYGLTDNYHDGGGCMVVANNLQEARDLLRQQGGVSSGLEAFTDEPDYSTLVMEDQDRVFIFPDAGCC